ncbi:MAG: hypothetical protein JWM26_1635 [Betaproteobacteria bacterium]|nr:hypothetical protein [Betaproteobacteria bacterium]
MVFKSGSKRAIPWLVACTLAMPLCSAAQSIVATPAGLEVGTGAGRESDTQEALDRFDPYRRELDDRSAGLDRRYGRDHALLRDERGIERDRAFEPVGPRVESPEFRHGGMELGDRLPEGSNVGGRDHGGSYVGGERMGGGYTGGEHMGAGYIGGQPMGGGHFGGGHR